MNFDQAAEHATAVQCAHEVQAVPPVQWDYQTRALDPACAARLPDPDATSAALTNYVYDKPAGHGTEPAVSAALRGRAAMTPQRARDISLIDQALSASLTGCPVTVYRGYQSGRHILPDDWRERDLTGLAWTDPGYSSVTADPGSAECYAGFEADRGFAARIRLPQGTPTIAIRDEPGGLDDEGEIVLPRGLTFRVTADSGKQGQHGIRWLDLTIGQAPGITTAATGTGAPGGQGSKAVPSAGDARARACIARCRGAEAARGSRGDADPVLRCRQ